MTSGSSSQMTSGSSSQMTSGNGRDNDDDLLLTQLITDEQPTTNSTSIEQENQLQLEKELVKIRFQLARSTRQRDIQQ